MGQAEHIARVRAALEAAARLLAQEADPTLRAELAPRLAEVERLLTLLDGGEPIPHAAPSDGPSATGAA